MRNIRTRYDVFRYSGGISELLLLRHSPRTNIEWAGCHNNIS